jgi:large subunit ribosomal protein L18e
MNKTKIEKKLKRKTNPELVSTIISAKKNDKWLKVAHLISMPKRKQMAMNLGEINKQAKDGETIVICGKVLSVGELNKKVKVVALGFSKEAKEKLKKNKIEIAIIEEEIKKNKDAKNIHILNEIKI